MIEVHLWRADLLCGILEVEPSGKIVATNTHKLNPAGKRASPYGDHIQTVTSQLWSHIML
jgi:hypothetical protein